MMVDLKETVSSEIPRGKLCFICGCEEKSAIHIALMRGDEVFDEARKDTPPDQKYHVFVSCFAAPDVENLLANKELQLKDFRKAIELRDAEIQRLTEIKKISDNVKQELVDQHNALIERDAKLADELDSFVHKTPNMKEERKLVRVVGLLRGEKRG